MSLIDLPFTRASGMRITRPASLGTYLALWRSRRALSRLDARARADVGLSSDAASREAGRGFWDVPESWRTH